MHTAQVLNLFHHLLETYHRMCGPLCKQSGLTQTALDILMFLANNPEYNTASDIRQVRQIKASLVSFNVEKLVKEGYLQRITVPEDRRKVRLVCTQKAEPVISAGRAVQKQFFERIYAGFDEKEVRIHLNMLERILQNVKEEG